MCSNAHHSSVQGVSVQLQIGARMRSRYGHSLSVKVYSSWNVIKTRLHIHQCNFLVVSFVIASSGAQVSSLIHVKPHAVVVHTFIEVLELVKPPSLSVLVEPIREHGVGCQSLSFEISLGGVFDEKILFYSFIVSLIVASWSHGDPSVDHWDQPLSHFHQVLIEDWQVFEVVFLVIGEVLVVVH